MPLTTAQLLASLGHLLDRALELSPDARAAWLAELRAERPELARELEALLDRESKLDADGFLLSGSGAAGPEGSPSLAGWSVGPYALEHPIGQGGMGSIWLAHRSDGRFEGRVAIKLLNLSLLDPVGNERFRREGSALARLAHPNIARLMDAGVTDWGQPYLTLELISGVRIDQYCADRRLTPRQRIELFQQVLGAVAHAHANLVIHRDLKPSNILVTPDGTVKLLDFGIAKLLAEGMPAGERKELTADGGYPLTPEYAAPEQVTGGAVTTATDVYALGVLLYLLLAGRHPAGEAASTAERVNTLLDADPTPLSTTLPGVGDLDTILAKAMAKEPERRYPTVAALAGDLGRYLRDEPVEARAASLGYRARKFIRRNREAVSAAAAIAVTLVATTAFSLVQMQEARRQRDAAVYEQQRADAQLEFQDLMLTSIGSEATTMREILDQGAVLLEQEYSGDPRLAASIALSLGQSYEQLGAFDRQLAMAARAESLAARVAAADLFLASRCDRFGSLVSSNLFREAARLGDSIRAELVGTPPEETAGCLMQFSHAALIQGRHDSAAALAHRGARLLEQSGDTTSMAYVAALNGEANALENVKRRREALAIYQRLAAMLDRTGRAGTGTRNVIRNNIGIALSNLGEVAAAEPILRETLETARRGNPDGEVHPAILINYCRTVLFLHKLDTAAVWYRHLFDQATDESAWFQADGARGLAEVALARGRLDEAAGWIRRHRDVLSRGQLSHSETNVALEASLAHARGDLVGATALFARSLEQMGYAEGRRTYQMRSVLIRAAECARDSGDHARALEYARAAAEIASSDPLSETRSAYVGEARLVEATTLAAAGDGGAARAAVLRALTALRYGVGVAHPRTREAEGLLARL